METAVGLLSSIRGYHGDQPNSDRLGAELIAIAIIGTISLCYLSTVLRST